MSIPTSTKCKIRTANKIHGNYIITTDEHRYALRNRIHAPACRQAGMHADKNDISGNEKPIPVLTSVCISGQSPKIKGGITKSIDQQRNTESNK
jgi:hypothetical protein